MLYKVQRVPQSRIAVTSQSEFFRPSCNPTEALYADIEQRGCGPCCAASAIQALTGQKVSVEDIFEDVSHKLGFTEKGTVHHVLAEVISGYGLRAQAAAFGRDAIHMSLPEAVFICSVTYKFPPQGAGGHLVFLHAQVGSEVIFMDPSGWGLKHSILPADRFFSSYSGRAIRIDLPKNLPNESCCFKTPGKNHG
ncbi:MAG: hypothetical protein ACI9U6_003536 [Loktanella salsilacus]|jgi:hypothetical protein|uniref:hypothetical protein n=1 Tax=Loktanella salsilacus TaxID=195913 RepID=UPI00398948C5